MAARKPVWVIFVNADLTEGRGPMVFHKIVTTRAKAVKYIKAQEGIYGSPQRRLDDLSSDTVERWNGYRAEETPVE